MKYTELKNSIKEGAKQVYLLEGDDAYFRINGEERIKSAFLQMPELNFSSFEGESLKGASMTALTSALKNFPFMAEKRIVKVTEFYPGESDFETYLKPLFADFPDSSILIIVNAGGKKGVDLKRKSMVTYVDCGRADTETVAKWAYITLRRANVTVSAGACEKIAEYCLNNMARVSVEVQKLIDYKKGGALDEGEIDGLVYKDADYRLYELTKTVPRRDFTGFCTILDELVKKSGDENFVLSGLLNYFKNLLTVLTSGKSCSELSSMLNMKEYGVKMSMEQARRMGEERLISLINTTYENISMAKNGTVTPRSALQSVKNAVFFEREIK